MIDLNNLEEYRENNRIEAKRSTGGFPNSLWETYSSFANTFGGVILLGVEEHKDTSLHAVDLPDREKLVKKFWATVNDKNKVSAKILTEKDVQLAEYQGKRIIVITVPRAERCDRPVYIGGDPYLGSYRRNGEGDYRCTRSQVNSMLRDARNTPADMKVLHNVRLSALDFDSVRDFRLRLKTSTRDDSAEKSSDCGFLKKIGAAAKGRDKNLHPTVAGLLTFGKREAVTRVFSGFSLEYLDVQNEDRCLPSHGENCGNLYDFFFAVCARLSAVALGSSVYNCLKEALANCLVNADYRQAGGIKVQLGADYASFTNPGNFRANITRATYGGVSDPRNLGVKKMFAMFGVGEGTGSGIPNIYAVWRRKGWAQPYFKEEFGPDRITLLLRFTKGESEKTTQSALAGMLVVQYLTENREAAKDELVKELKLNASNAEKVLAELTGKKIITEINGKYKLSR